MLSLAAEEVATFYGKMLDHEYTKKVFQNNFFSDWRKVRLGLSDAGPPSPLCCPFRSRQSQAWEGEVVGGPEGHFLPPGKLFEGEVLGGCVHTCTRPGFACGLCAQALLAAPGQALGPLVCLFWLLGTWVLHRALWGRASPSPQVPRGWLGHGLCVCVCVCVAELGAAKHVRVPTTCGVAGRLHS